MFFINLLLLILKCLVYLFLSMLTLFISLVVVLKVLLEPKSGVCRCKTQLHDKVVLVTGGNAGIGLETARELARRGARVIIACRNVSKSEAAVADIKESTGNTNVEYRRLNLCSFSSIREFANNFNKTEPRLDILVNNAGSAGLPERISDDGIDLVMQTNHMGPFLLTNLLMKKLVASKPSRIIIVSSYLHNFAQLNTEDLKCLNIKGYYVKYANSKMCNLLWMKALAKKLPDGVTVNGLHPGFVRTEIFKRLPPFIQKIIHYITVLLFKNAKEGAQTSIHLCVSPELNNVSGGYYKDCNPHPHHKIINDEVLVETVWDKCLRITEGNQ